MMKQFKNLTEERVDHSEALAFELMQNLINDGNDPDTVFTVFMVGASICASMHEMKKKTFLDGTGKCYEAYSHYGKALNEIYK